MFVPCTYMPPPHLSSACRHTDWLRVERKRILQLAHTAASPAMHAWGGALFIADARCCTCKHSHAWWCNVPVCSGLAFWCPCCFSACVRCNMAGITGGDERLLCATCTCLHVCMSNHLHLVVCTTCLRPACQAPPPSGLQAVRRLSGLYRAGRKGVGSKVFQDSCSFF